MLQRGKRKTEVFEEIVREAEHNASELHSFPHGQTSRRMPKTYVRTLSIESAACIRTRPRVPGA